MDDNGAINVVSFKETTISFVEFDDSSFHVLFPRLELSLVMMAMVDRKSLHFGRSRVVSPLRQWTFPRESFLLIRILDSFRFVRIICSSPLPFLGPKSNSWRNPFFRLAEFNLVKGTSNFFYRGTLPPL